MKTFRAAFVLVLTVVMMLAGTQAAQAKSKFSVSLTASVTTVSLGGTVKLSGSVSPNAKGKSVSIQRKYASGSWKTITTTKLSSTSKYSKTIKPTTGGPTFYRVVKPSSSSRSTGYSPTRRVNVFRWRNLTTLPVTNGAIAFYDDWSMNGNKFPASISTTLLTGSPTWNIAVPRCTKIRTYVGMDDDSLAGSTGSSQLLLDFPGGPLWGVSNDDNLAPNKNPRYVQKTFEPGHTTLSMAGSISRPNDSAPAYLTLGSPKLYCNS